MSQTMTAVFFASQSARSTTVWNRPLPGFDSTRLRIWSASVAGGVFGFSARAGSVKERERIVSRSRVVERAGFMVGNLFGSRSEGNGGCGGSEWAIRRRADCRSYPAAASSARACKRFFRASAMARGGEPIGVDTSRPFRHTIPRAMDGPRSRQRRGKRARWFMRNRCLIYPILLIALASGCQSLHRYRPVSVLRGTPRQRSRSPRPRCIFPIP